MCTGVGFIYFSLTRFALSLAASDRDVLPAGPKAPRASRYFATVLPLSPQFNFAQFSSEDVRVEVFCNFRQLIHALNYYEL